MSTEEIEAITKSLPPATDHITYLTILESHISPALLPTLNTILQDADLTQNIGWDLIHILLPMAGGEQCLGTIARLGNPREVILKVTEALQTLELDSDGAEDTNEGPSDAPRPTELMEVDKFCILVNLLSILHPRIRTQYPSRFLSTSLMAILSAYRPSNQATTAVTSFVRAISGKSRPPLPGRKSSMKIHTAATDSGSSPCAPDPEAQAEQPDDGAIQIRLLQSFVTHILEDYVNSNPLEWAARLQESFEPGKVVPGKKSLGDAYKEEPLLVTSQENAGELVSLLRDLDLSDYQVLFDAIYKTESDSPESDDVENYPSTPESIPLSRGGALFLISSYIFSSILFGSQTPQPTLSIFPDHTKILKSFIRTDHPETIGGEDPGVIDAVLAIGLWLEHTNKFVSGPLEDEDFLQHLQSLSLLSANNPSPTLRYAAHALTSSILHAHPVDRLRLTFITDTLEECPYDSLKASAVSWLKEEIITAEQRKVENVFASTAALTAVQPYLFPDNTTLSKLNGDELVEALGQTYTLHMAVVNFLYFIGGEKHKHVVPPGMIAVVEEIYLDRLKTAQEKALSELLSRSKKSDGMVSELQLLGERISMCLAQLNAA